MTYDLLIKNARVVDGSGEPSFQADVAVHQGKIVGVGKINAAATRTIDAEGRVVAPGFIDHHTHFDPQALWDPYCGSSVQNGHTTIMVGQCGQVIAPARPGDHDWYLKFFADAEAIPLPVLEQGVNFTWESVAEYMDALGQRRGCNVATLVGHSGIRRYVMGEAASARAEATPEELAAMQRLLRDGMYAGALGFSTAPVGRGDPAGAATDDGTLGACRRARGIGDRRHAGGRRRARRHQGNTGNRPAIGRPHRPSDHLQPRLAAHRAPRGVAGTSGLAGKILESRRPGLRFLRLGRCRTDL